jgi:hypothetical protein
MNWFSLNYLNVLKTVEGSMFVFWVVNTVCMPSVLSMLLTNERLVDPLQEPVSLDHAFLTDTDVRAS